MCKVLGEIENISETAFELHFCQDSCLISDFARQNSNKARNLLEILGRC